MQNTKLAFKKNFKEQRRTIIFKKEKLVSKDSTIAILSKKLIEAQVSEKAVSRPLKDVLMVKDETTKIRIIHCADLLYSDRYKSHQSTKIHLYG